MPPLIIAHRGLHARLPENSLGAFRAAASAGIKWVELDIQQSRDGQPVIIHDKTVDRVTGMTGAVDRFWATNLRRMRLLHENKPTEWMVPVLSDQLPLSDLRVAALVEIKPPDAPLLVNRTARAMRACGLEWMIQSFDGANLRHASRYARETPQALLVNHAEDMAAALREDWPALHVAVDLLSGALVQKLHSQGRSVGVWTPNTEPELRNAIELGVDRIITDEPLLARALVEEVGASA